MSRYLNQLEYARKSDLSKKRYLTDIEAAVYVSLGRTHFREWAEQIGCKRRIGRRVLNDRSVIDEALKKGESV